MLVGRPSASRLSCAVGRREPMASDDGARLYPDEPTGSPSHSPPTPDPPPPTRPSPVCTDGSPSPLPTPDTRPHLSPRAYARQRRSTTRRPPPPPPPHHMTPHPPPPISPPPPPPCSMLKRPACTKETSGLPAVKLGVVTDDQA